LSFDVEKALSLQGQTIFQRLAGWVLQHIPQPEVPFQVDDNNEKNKTKLVLGHPYRHYNACPHHYGELMEAHILQRKQGGSLAHLMNLTPPSVDTTSFATDSG
jgi:hypothetical protein